jgi:hypothetical protein
MESQVRWDGGSDTRRLKALEDENTKLKKLLAKAMLASAMLEFGGLHLKKRLRLSVWGPRHLS